MLTLTRKSGECIRIGDHIRIVIREVRGRQVRIGIEAPVDVKVHREEVYLRVRDENATAARPGAADLAALEALVVTSRGCHNRGTGKPMEEPVTPAVIVRRGGIRPPKSLRKAEEILPAPSA